MNFTANFATSADKNKRQALRVSAKKISIILIVFFIAIPLILYCCFRFSVAEKFCMTNPLFKCYRAEMKLPEHYFFVLNKGLNSGKPLDNPCPNCFLAICESKSQRDAFFALSYGMWQGKLFHPLLKGSCVPFITKNDLVATTRTCADKAFANPVNFYKVVNIVLQAKIHREQLIKQLDLTNKLCSALMLSCFK